MRSVSALWIGGELSAYESLSLRSFAVKGFEVNLYTYEPNLEVPSGVTLLDANEIVDAGKVFENPNQRGTWAGFSDVFRYELLRLRETVWIDTDVVALGKEFVSKQGYVFGWESPEYINGAVLGAPKDSELVGVLNQQVALVDPHSFKWGDLGPKLISRVVRDLGLEPFSQSQKAFYPIGFKDVWMLFDPDSLQNVEAALSESQSLHWWNDALRRVPFKIKKLLPPEGSYFGNLFEMHGVDVNDMKRLKSNWARRNWRLLIAGGHSLGSRLKRVAIRSIGNSGL